MEIRAFRDAQALLRKMDDLPHCFNLQEWVNLLSSVHAWEAATKDLLHDTFHGRANGLPLKRPILEGLRARGNWNLMVLLHLSSDGFTESTWLVNRKTAVDFMEAVIAYVHFDDAAWEQFDEQLILLAELSRLIEESLRDK